MKKYRALGDNCIIKMETGEITSKGGIVIASAGTREAEAREEAVIEQKGKSAFDDLEEGEVKPEVGDSVVIARYEGKTLGKFKDGFERRIIQSTRILAAVEGSDDE